MKNARNRQNNLHFNIFFCILEELSHIHPTNKFVGFLRIFVKITKVSHRGRYGSKNKFIIHGFINKNSFGVIYISRTHIKDKYYIGIYGLNEIFNCTFEKNILSEKK